ncbi:MAG: TetR family transcriptional regulator [Bdellovibrionota bacterium]
MKTLRMRKGSMDDSSREKLLSAATKLFSKKGFDRVSIRDIAKESGCNICLVSYYFGGKEKLYLNIFEAFFARVGKYLDAAHTAHADLDKPITREEFETGVSEKIRFMVDEFLRYPELKILMHREVMDGFPHTKKVFDEHLGKVKTGAGNIYERAKRSGLLKAKIDGATFAILLTRSVEAYFVARMFAKPIQEMGIDPVKNTDLFVEQIEEIFLRGALK